MATSPFYARIRAQVLQLTAAVPEGKVCTYQSMGEHLAVAPRHVAYILSQLGDDEKFVVPWHRVVASDGSLGTPKRNPDGMTQAELLRAEGLPVSGNRLVTGLDRLAVAAGQLPSGLPPQTRPDDAPMPSGPTRRARRR